MEDDKKLDDKPGTVRLDFIPPGISISSPRADGTAVTVADRAGG